MKVKITKKDIDHLKYANDFCEKLSKCEITEIESYFENLPHEILEQEKLTLEEDKLGLCVQLSSMTLGYILDNRKMKDNRIIVIRECLKKLRRKCEDL